MEDYTTSWELRKRTRHNDELINGHTGSVCRIQVSEPDQWSTYEGLRTRPVVHYSVHIDITTDRSSPAPAPAPSSSSLSSLSLPPSTTLSLSLRTLCAAQWNSFHQWKNAVNHHSHLINPTQTLKLFA